MRNCNGKTMHTHTHTYIYTHSLIHTPTGWIKQQQKQISTNERIKHSYNISVTLNCFQAHKPSKHKIHVDILLQSKENWFVFAVHKNVHHNQIATEYWQIECDCVHKITYLNVSKFVGERV